MNQIPEEIILYISSFLHNEDIYNLSYISNYFYNTLTQSFFIDYINHRYHPVIFNILDNFCYICNRGIVCFNMDKKLDIDYCNHHFFIN